MGANSDELKKIKCVVRCAVIMAYNLILETSFLLDQKAMFSTISLSQVVNSTATDDPPAVSGEQGDSLLFEPYNPVLSGLSSLSASLKKVMGDNFPLCPTSGQSMPSCFIDNRSNEDDQEQTDTVVNQSDTDQKVTTCDDEVASEKERSHTPIVSQGESLESQVSGNMGNGVKSMDTESILVLISSRNASKGTMCAHGHFSRIKFYQNFDIPLGSFLQQNLLSQVRRTQ